MASGVQPSGHKAVPAAVAARVWDLPMRLFHWLLVALVLLQYASGQFKLLSMRWHFWLGYATLALLLFRLLWGLAGSDSARFATFLRGPRAVASHIDALFSGKSQVYAGHNPLGGWASLALLVCLAAQVVTGLFSSDHVDVSGPLAAHVADATIRQMTRLHHLIQNLLLLLIVLHVVVVLLYLLLKRENLIVPMLDGRKTLHIDPQLHFARLTRAVALLAISIAIVATMVAWA